MILGGAWAGSWGMAWGGAWGEAWRLFSEPYATLSFKDQAFVRQTLESVYTIDAVERVIVLAVEQGLSISDALGASESVLTKQSMISLFNQAASRFVGTTEEDVFITTNPLGVICQTTKDEVQVLRKSKTN